jgi:sulfonate transport system substrate-binding protein
MSLTRRLLLAASLATGLASFAAASAQVKEIKIDFATYNPVSLVLKDRAFLEKALEKDGIKVRWVQSLGSNKALEFLNAGSLDFGSTAGAAALIARINGNPIKSIYVYSRPEWTALVTRKETGIAKVEDLKGKRVAVTRGTDPHIFLVRALHEAKLTEKDVKLVLLQHPDGRTALERGDVDAWAGLDPLMAGGRDRRGASPLPPQRGGEHLGHPQRPRGFRQGEPRAGDRACSRPSKRQRLFALANPAELTKSLIAYTKRAEP